MTPRSCSSRVSPEVDVQAIREAQAVLRTEIRQPDGALAQDIAGAALRHQEQPLAGDGIRSEEHTSELQSLMRISYAVFCLKKKKNKQSHTPKHQENQNTRNT